MHTKINQLSISIGISQTNYGGHRQDTSFYFDSTLLFQLCQVPDISYILAIINYGTISILICGFCCMLYGNYVLE